MTRKLPWVQQGASTSRPQRPAKTKKSPVKRPRAEETTLDSHDQEMLPSLKKSKISFPGRTPSTSPPPAPPSESFMDDGMEHDDKFRMVEDEFLTVAQRFTVHLHAAEYKRQQRVVNARNADAINSISRPVTGKMPDHTRRKVESVARSKKQLDAVQTLLGKPGGDPGDSEDSDDVASLPYVGTTLHGLMDSPQKRATSLAKVSSIMASTRAAAGFPRPAARTKLEHIARPESPKYKAALQLVSRASTSSHKQGSLTASSDEDDDLDTSIPAPKFVPSPRSNSRPVAPPPRAMRALDEPSIPAPISVQSRMNGFSSRTSDSKFATDHDSSGSTSRIARRLEQARLQKANREMQDGEKKKLDIIPTFL